MRKYLPLVFIVIGFALAWVVQFKLNFLGANHITFKAIIGLWLGVPCVGFYIGLILSVK